MCTEETNVDLTTFRGVVTEGSCKINWETAAISGQPAVKLKFVATGKKASYKIEPAPEKSTQSYYQKLVEAAAAKARLNDPDMSFPSSILNVSVSGKTYSLHKG